MVVVVPANAHDHTRSPLLGVLRKTPSQNQRRWLWVPAFAFRRDDGLIRHCQRWMRPVRIYHRPASDATHSISISIAGFGSALTTQVVRAG